MLDRGIFRPSDVRGVVTGDDVQWDETGARAIGAALVDVLDLAGQSLVLGHDMRQRGAQLADAFALGVVEAGAEVVMLGLASTDQVWFTAAVLEIPAVQVTAGHDSSEHNGLSFRLPHAEGLPLGFVPRLSTRARQRHDDLLHSGRSTLDPAEPSASQGDAQADRPGITNDDTLGDYAAQLRNSVDLQGLRPLSVVVDTANGMAALTGPAVLGERARGELGLEVHALNQVLDGTFPQHAPSPTQVGSTVQAAAQVRTRGADLGLVFGVGADRCVVLDEHGDVVSASAVAALLAREGLRRHPGGTIVTNTLGGSLLADVVAQHGGELLQAAGGHEALRAEMARTGAILGVEDSGSYRFADFWGIDCAMLAALHVIAVLGREQRPLSELEGCACSGEITLPTGQPHLAVREVRRAFERHQAVRDLHDGLVLRGNAGNRGAWFARIRPSRRHQEVRISVEAADAEVMAAVRDDLCGIVSAQGRLRVA